MGERGTKGVRGHDCTMKSPQYIIDLARAQRTNPTPAEQALWERIRRRQVCGYQFRRQQPIERYITDFICLPLKLIIEVDGSVHEARKPFDENRDAYLAACGYTTLRFTNDEALQSIDTVVRKIEAAVHELE